MKDLTTIEKMNELGAKGIPFFFMFDFEGKQLKVIQLDELAKIQVLVDTPVFSNWIIEKSEVRKKTIQFEKYPIPFEEYKPKFDHVLSELNFGNTYLINLTQPTPILSLIHI